MLKVISLNIEAHQHLDLILPFFEKEQADILCLPETFAVDALNFERLLGMQAVYAPMANVDVINPHIKNALGAWGVALFSKLPLKDSGVEYYVKHEGELPLFFNKNDGNSMDRAVVWATVEKEGQEFTIATTHFTWTPDGNPSNEQRRDLIAMLKITEKLPPHIICGDFNAPRGREIFTKLAEKYQDNVPPEVTTSIDPHMHKAGKLELMVDGMFSQPEYQLENVRVVSGVSDHQAIVAEAHRLQ